MMQNIKVLIVLLLFCVGILGCVSRAPMSLMPTPILYKDARINPFAHLQAGLADPAINVFYCTLRAPSATAGQYYGNQFSSQLHLGKAQIVIAGPDLNWSQVQSMSLQVEENSNIPLLISSVHQQATIGRSAHYTSEIPSGMHRFIDAINAELIMAKDKDIMIYVHGTKVDFANGVSLAAEVDHFSGRDFVSIAFSWPSHQNIFSYLIGIDKHRAIDSAPGLAQLIRILSEHTHAEKINILSYSAGGRVASRALVALADGKTGEALKLLARRYRIGSVVFAAADVEENLFLKRIEAISGLSERAVITVADKDKALIFAQKLMGGAPRIGSSAAERDLEQFILAHHLRNVEIIDVSLGAATRGFDITGHHYWYRHPWMSSDIVFLMRTDLPAVHRGLSRTELTGVWYLSAEYPSNVTKAAAQTLKGQW